MFDSTRTVTILLATLTVVGFGVAPMVAIASPSDGSGTAYQMDDSGLSTQDGGLSTQANSSGPFPQEVCTDLLDMLHDEAPYDMLVWVDDLPEDAQPPGVPWSVITPKAIAGIVVGATPNQCDVYNPNDPPWDPANNDDDNLAPDGGGDVQQGEEGEVLFIVNGTLDNTSEGPSVEGNLGLDLGENGTIDPDSELHDGEKAYGVDPQLKYWNDGTTYFETDVFVFGTRVGVVEDCTGPECTFSTRGLPNFVDYPALPSHSDSDPDAGSGGDGDSGSSDGSDGTGSDDGSGSDDGTGSDGPGSDSDSTDDGTGADGSGSGDGADGSDGTDDGTGSGDGTGSDDGETGGDGADGSDGDSTDDGTDGSDGDDSTDGGDGGETQNQNQASSGGQEDQQAQQAAAADGSGLGVVVALVVFILGAAAIAPRD